MTQRIRLTMACTLVCALFFAACSAGGSSGGSTASTSNGTSSTGSSSTSTTTSPPPTATVSKPTSVPMMTVAKCEGLLSITEANQFVSPPAAISTVMAGNATDISSCQYLSSPSSAPLILGFESFIPGTQMSTYAMQLAAKTLPGATLTVSHAVSGVGDQAWFVAGTFSGHGVSAHADALYVADGSVLIIVDNTNIDGMAPIGTTDNGAIQTEFVQIANLVVSRL